MSRVFRVALSALLALCLSPFSSLAFADVVTDSESQYQEEDLQQDDIMTSDDLQSPDGTYLTNRPNYKSTIVIETVRNN